MTAGEQGLNCFSAEVRYLSRDPLDMVAYGGSSAHTEWGCSEPVIRMHLFNPLKLLD